MGLDTDTIDACFSAHPLNDEDIVQEGLNQWCNDRGTQLPTWGVLIDAMKYSGIEKWCVQVLQEKLGSLGILFVISTPALCPLYKFDCCTYVCMVSDGHHLGKECLFLPFILVQTWYLKKDHLMHCHRW